MSDLNPLLALIEQYRVLIYPTEAVYGLGCHPHDRQGVDSILNLKQRSIKKGFILIGAHWDQLSPYAESVPESLLAQAFKTWPGPYAWLFPCKPSVPDYLRGDHHTIALRITAHPVASQLCDRLGHALISTSANPAGQPPARDPETVFQYFPDLHPEQLIPGALGSQAHPSSIQDVLTGQNIR